MTFFSKDQTKTAEPIQAEDKTAAQEPMDTEKADDAVTTEATK